MSNLIIHSDEEIDAVKALIVATAKRQIAMDVACGLVPPKPQSLSELDDYVDCNCYGGLCDDKMHDYMTLFFGGNLHDGEMPAGMHKFIVQCQDEINEWLAGGMQ